MIFNNLKMKFGNVTAKNIKDCGSLPNLYTALIFLFN